MKHLRSHEHLPQPDVLCNQLEALHDGLPHIYRHVRCVIYCYQLHQVTLLDHRYDLTTPCKSLYRMTCQCDLSIIEQLPLLETHQYLGIYTLEILVLTCMLEAQLFRLIKDVFPEVVLFRTVAVTTALPILTAIAITSQLVGVIFTA